MATTADALTPNDLGSDLHNGGGDDDRESSGCSSVVIKHNTGGKRKEKSLGALAVAVISWKNTETACNNPFTAEGTAAVTGFSQRRIYDVFNIFHGIGLIGKGKKAPKTYVWRGRDGMVSTLRELCQMDTLKDVVFSDTPAEKLGLKTLQSIMKSGQLLKISRICAYCFQRGVIKAQTPKDIIAELDAYIVQQLGLTLKFGRKLYDILNIFRTVGLFQKEGKASQYVWNDLFGESDQFFEKNDVYLKHLASVDINESRERNIISRAASSLTGMEVPVEPKVLPPRKSRQQRSYSISVSASSSDTDGEWLSEVSKAAYGIMAISDPIGAKLKKKRAAAAKKRARGDHTYNGKLSPSRRPQKPAEMPPAPIGNEGNTNDGIDARECMMYVPPPENEDAVVMMEIDLDFPALDGDDWNKLFDGQINL